MPALRPSYAIVSAVYNVDRYLSDFLSSLDAQTIDHSRVRVILVDDGSVDGSGETLDAWAETTDLSVTVVHQDNAGQGAARNAGIQHLTDETWVTFTDPDDFLGPETIQNIDNFLDAHRSAIMAVSHQQDYWEDRPGPHADRHPLRYRFDGGDQLVDIDRFPRFIQMSAATAFFRVSEVRRQDLAFSDRVRPNFEDGHFVQRYLLRQSRRLVGFLESAQYFYRRRADGSSTLQNAAEDPRRYTDVLEFGYLPLLRAASRQGSVPRWLQNVIIYELHWTFRSEESMFGKTAGLSPAVQERFHELVAEIRGYLDDVAIEAFDLIHRSISQIEVLRHGYSDAPWHWDAVRVGELDSDQELVKLHYRFTGSLPTEEFFVRGRPVSPRHVKIRDLTYMGRALVQERIVWVWSKGEIAVKLDGADVPLTYSWPQNHVYSLRQSSVVKHRRQAAAPIGPGGGSRRRKTGRTDQAERRAERLARHQVFRRLFRDAWVLMDRDINAHDNAEHLFKYLRKRRRDINAWFVVKKGSEDWNRLKSEGYRRVIAHGSLLWRILCLNATHIISSHADHYVYRPFQRSDNRWTWKFVFLQHGVTKDDISRWLERKPISGIVTTTVAEYASIGGNHSEYSLSTKEVALTGMPRHDLLAKKATGAKPSYVLVMPSWRQYLAGEVVEGSGERAVRNDMADSAFVQQWRRVLTSERLARSLKNAGLHLVFMPHPNLKAYIDMFSVPAGAKVATYEEDDVQMMLASAALVVTDYSSIAFDAAIINKPVAYFQFDRELVFGGNHVTRQGYFSYARDGFGPVADDADSCVDQLIGLLDTPGELQEPYRSRVANAFTVRGGGACRRVTEFIESLSVPLDRKQACTAVPAPEAPGRALRDEAAAVSSDVAR